MSIEDEARTEAVEALDRLTQIALDNTSEDVHDAVYEDVARVRAEWQASRKVEAAPSDTDREAIEAVERAAYFDLSQGLYSVTPHLQNAMHALLSRASQPVQVEVTDDMVKRADAAYWKSVDDCDEHADPMRAALEAALGGGE